MPSLGEDPGSIQWIISLLVHANCNECFQKDGATSIYTLLTHQILGPSFC